jgi:hypothetical protein
MRFLKTIIDNVLNNKMDNYPEIFNNSVTQSLINHNPLTAKAVSDIKHYSNYFNGNTSQGTMPPPGEHKFLSNAEEMMSDVNYKHFTYLINECGFRDALPANTDKNIFGYFGCSFTFGEGLDTTDNFPYKISKHFNKPCLNLGQSGTGATRIALTFAAAANIWNMETAVVTLPNWARFHYVDTKNGMKSLHLPWDIDDAECNNIRKLMVENFSDQYMLSATKDAINYIVTTAKLKNINLILTSWDPDVSRIINLTTKYLCPHYSMSAATDDINNKARDKIHPGINLVNQQVSNLIKYINESKYVTV